MIQRGSRIWREVCSNGKWGTGVTISKSQMLESKRNPRPQRSDISWNAQKWGARTYRDHIQRLGIAPGWGMGPPLHKILTQNCSCLKEIWGQKVEQRLKETPSKDCPTWGSIPYAAIKSQQLLMPRSPCWQKPDMAVSWEAVRALLIQRWMLAANHQNENGNPNGGVRERTEGVGVCNPKGRTTISTNQTPPPKAPRD